MVGALVWGRASFCDPRKHIKVIIYDFMMYKVSGLLLDAL